MCPGRRSLRVDGQDLSGKWLARVSIKSLCVRRCKSDCERGGLSSPLSTFGISPPSAYPTSRNCEKYGLLLEVCEEAVRIVVAHINRISARLFGKSHTSQTLNQMFAIFVVEDLVVKSFIPVLLRPIGRSKMLGESGGKRIKSTSMSVSSIKGSFKLRVRSHSFNPTTSVDSGFLGDACRERAQRGESLALGGAGGREAGTGWWWDDGIRVGKGREVGVPQFEDDGGLLSLGVAGISVDQQSNAAQAFACRNMRVTALP